jgi:predicted nucleic acid-binding protein
MAAVAAGQIGAITLDTNTFDAAQCNLTRPIFLSLGQFKGTGVRYLLTDVVAGEVRAHIQRRAEDAATRLRAAAREFDLAWGVTDALPKVTDTIAATPDARGSAQAALDAYIAATAAEVQPSAGNVDLDALLERYFSARPPFANKTDKKHEFPDALALMSLEAWAQAGSKFVIAVSKDSGWRKYAANSDWIVCVDDLRGLLGSFNEEDTFVAKRVVAQLNQGELAELSTAIDEAVQSFVDDMYPNIDASTAFHYYAEYEGSSLVERRDIELVTVDAISSTDESITISFDVNFTVEANASFTFYVRDEGDNIPIGGAAVSRTIDLSLPITIEVARNDPSALFDIDVSGDPFTSLDFGHVEADEEEPEPENWGDGEE